MKQTTGTASLRRHTARLAVVAAAVLGSAVIATPALADDAVVPADPAVVADQTPSETPDEPTEAEDPLPELPIILEPTGAERPTIVPQGDPADVVTETYEYAPADADPDDTDGSGAEVAGRSASLDATLPDTGASDQGLDPAWVGALMMLGGAALVGRELRPARSRR